MKDLAKLFGAFFKVGMFTIGGGLAMLPLIQRTVVEDHKWLKEEEMVDCIAICQALPGVIAINTATFVGYKRRKLTGAVAATLGVVMPSLLVIISASLFLGAVGENSYIAGAFTAVKAASCALILYAAVKLGKQVLKNRFAWIVAIIAFVMIAVFDVTALWAIVVGAAAGLIYTQKHAVMSAKAEADTEAAADSEAEADTEITNAKAENKAEQEAEK